MQCDMCGSEKKLMDAIVEGVMMKVCENCAKYGEVIPIKSGEEIASLPKLRKTQHVKDEKEFDYVLEKYAEMVKKAREKKGLKQEEVAKAIAEKESVIHNIESGHLRPSIRLAKKIGAFLGVNLIAKEERKIEKKNVDFRDPGITIGDLLKGKK